MKNFALSWRFTDPAFNKLPLKDLESITPVAEGESVQKWNVLVSSQHHIHLSKFSELISCFEIDTDHEIIGRKLLESNIPLSDSEDIRFFWSPKCSVITNWKTVKKYWTDFFYPDDDNTVVVSQNLLVIYSEERFHIYHH